MASAREWRTGKIKSGMLIRATLGSASRPWWRGQYKGKNRGTGSVRPERADVEVWMLGAFASGMED